MTHTIVVLAYVLVLVGVAVYKSRSVKTADDFMVAGRSVPVCTDGECSALGFMTWRRES